MINQNNLFQRFLKSPLINFLILSYKRFLRRNFNRSHNIQESVNYEALIPEKYSVELRLPINRIVESFDFSKPSIVIIDDSELILTLVEEYLANCSITSEDYNILRFYGLHAPFILKDTLNILKSKGLEKIEYAIIDIVLPGKIKEENKYVKMDGIDVAILLNRDFGTDNFFFFSGNVLNLYVEYIHEKAEKFYNYFKLNLSEFIIPKNSDDDSIQERIEELISQK